MCLGLKECIVDEAGRRGVVGVGGGWWGVGVGGGGGGGGGGA